MKKSPLQKADSGPVAFPQCRLTETSLQFDGQPSQEDWSRAGRSLDRIQRSIHWWIGDWWMFGERSYGEMASQEAQEAVEEATGYDYGTVRNDAFVAEKIEFARRRANLSHTHHAEVAKLDPPEQDKWLDLAEKEGLTHRELRESIRAGKIVRLDDIKRDSGTDSGLLLIEGVIGRALLWKRNVLEAGKIKLTPITAETIRMEVVRPLQTLTGEIEAILQKAGEA